MKDKIAIVLESDDYGYWEEGFWYELGKKVNLHMIEKEFDLTKTYTNWCIKLFLSGKTFEKSAEIVRRLYTMKFIK